VAPAVVGGRGLLARRPIAYLNNGSYGSPPRPVFDALVDYNRFLAQNPTRHLGELDRRKEEVRRKLAVFVGCDPEELALTRNTTEGNSLAATGLELRPGDEVLTSNHEHPGGIEPWRMRAKRHGIVVRELPIPSPPESAEQLVSLFADAIAPRTKVIFVSYVFCTTGLVFPAKAVCRIARERGVLTVLDGAHAPGHFRFDCHDIGCDVMSMSPHKWLDAPWGNGSLYVRRDVQDRLWPSIASGGWDGDTAARYDAYGTRDVPVTCALGDAIDFQEAIGRNRIEERGRSLIARFKREVQRIPGVTLRTSMDPALSGLMAAVTVPDFPHEKVLEQLWTRHRIVGRAVAYDVNASRFSTHFYNTPAEVDHLVAALDDMARHGLG
jgi:isopenicillin-N epimerase